MNPIVYDTIKATGQSFVDAGILEAEKLAVILGILENGNGATITPPAMLKIRRAAEILEVNERTVRRWIKDGRLKVVTIGGTVRIPQDELLRVDVE